jgi:membrane-associated phospholipid phosphatase
MRPLSDPLLPSARVRMKPLLSLLALFVFMGAAWPEPLQAQESPGGTPVTESSPYTFSLVRHGAFVASGVGTLLLARALDEPGEPLAEQALRELDADRVNGFDRPATSRYDASLQDRSRSLARAALVLPALLLMEPRSWSDLPLLAVMYGETLLLSTSLPSISHRIVDRTPPWAYNEELSDELRGEPHPDGVFIAGRTAATFSSAVFLATVVGDYRPDSVLRYGVWAGALLAAGGIAYLEFESGRHYPSDLIGGALVGGVIGSAIPRAHRRTSAPGVSRQVQVRPVPEGGVELGVRLSLP